MTKKSETVVVVCGREAPDGGDRCILTADARCCRQKPTQHCKAIILQLKKQAIFKSGRKNSWLNGRPVLYTITVNKLELDTMWMAQDPVN